MPIPLGNNAALRQFTENIGNTGPAGMNHIGKLLMGKAVADENSLIGRFAIDICNIKQGMAGSGICLLYTSPSPRD